jgi:hypothetical protein
MQLGSPASRNRVSDASYVAFLLDVCVLKVEVIYDEEE